MFWFFPILVLQSFIGLGSAKLHALVPTRHTRHWYASYTPACLRALSIIITCLARLTKFYTVRNDHGHTERWEFSVLDQKHPFWANLAPKNLNCQSKLNFFTQTNSDMRNSMVMLTFSVFDQKYTFWVNLVQKTKIVSLSWNLVPILIWICKIYWLCSLFHFVQNIKIISLNLILVPRLIRICTIQWRYWLFLFSTKNTLFGQICSKKPKLSV